ncbi:beta-1,3-galactosyltransferase 2-like isoform X2 [Hyla sarda]|nr:beta-1,3-galactosyltransferase 2-like isoform X2 [Hyla sarda]XP_056425110.1 beta-1,3-galactosyltransferase 2-like isoform X2 [Hyla sarda]
MNRGTYMKIFSLCFIITMLIIVYTYNKGTHDELFLVHQKPTTPRYPYRIEEDKKCKGDAPFLVLLIFSSPEEFHTRNVLRSTWANESLVSGVRIVRLFLLGMSNRSKEVIEESEQFHDIIMQDFLDSYYNLTAKTLMGMEWVSRLCPNVKYVMKIDTDMFFNPWFLVEMVLQPQSPPKKNFFTGLIVHDALPHRDKESKWYISTEIYSQKYYPPYCSGTGYVFSGDMAKKIYLVAEVLQIFPFEDVFVGMCLQRLKVKISELREAWFIGERVPYARCKFTKLVTVHRFTPKELLEVWPDFLAAVETC